MKNRSLLFLFLPLVALLYSFNVAFSTSEKSTAVFAFDSFENYSENKSHPDGLLFILESKICETDFEVVPSSILNEDNKFTINNTSYCEQIVISFSRQYKSVKLYDLFCSWKHHIS
jgi:hypothetical protein